jgi:hypothetical protein
VLRKLLFASLALAPVAVGLHYLADLSETSEFVLSALALIPLAWLIGEATEHAAEHTGPGIGGFLNATFGNAPELIIALIAVNDGLTEVVRGSLIGSVVSNLLLVLGALRPRPTVLGVVPGLPRNGAFLVPSIPGWNVTPTATRWQSYHLNLGRAPARLRRRHLADVAAPPRAARRERRRSRGSLHYSWHSGSRRSRRPSLPRFRLAGCFC